MIAELPDYGASRAVLIGAGKYDHLTPLPADRNITGLWDVLVNRPAGLAGPDAVRVADPRTALEVVAPLTRACQQASDLLIVYFTGHGLVDGQQLRLALAGTDPAHPVSSLAFADLARPISDSPARIKLILLDCCYSARAIEVPIADSMRLARAKGTHLIMSSGATQPSKAHPGAEFSAFTRALIETLRDGVAGPAEYLTSDIVYTEVSRRLAAGRDPLPRQRVVNDANHVPLLRNPGYRGADDGALPQRIRRDLTELLAGLSPELVKGTLSGAALLELRVALVDLPPVSETELGRIWHAATGTLAGDLAGVPVRSYRELFDWADRFLHQGGPADAAVFRCADQVVRRHGGHPAIGPLRRWLRRHRPTPYDGTAAAAPPAGTAAVVVVLHPCAAPEAGGSGAEARYEMFLWSHTEATGFLQAYPPAEQDPAPFTAADAPAVVAAHLPAALEQLARLRPAEAREPIVEFILPEELWDTAVECWPAEFTGNQIGLLYPTVVRPLDRQRNLRWHGRWVRSWQALADLLAADRDVPIVCRSCHGGLDHRQFGDLLAGDPHHGALVLLDRAPRGEPARAALRSAMVAGAPAFFWLRGPAPAAADRRGCPVEHVHTALGEHLRGHRRDDIPWLLLALRGARQRPLGDGLALMWDDPARRPPLHQPLVTPVGGRTP